MSEVNAVAPVPATVSTAPAVAEVIFNAPPAVAMFVKVAELEYLLTAMSSRI